MRGNRRAATASARGPWPHSLAAGPLARRTPLPWWHAFYEAPRICACRSATVGGTSVSRATFAQERQSAARLTANCETRDGLAYAIVVSVMHALDTTPAAAAVHEEAQRRLGPAGRLRSALELSDLTHSFAVAGIRRRHPDLSDADARAELARLLYVPR